AHHEQAQGGGAQVAGEVEPDAPAPDRVEVLGEGGAVPGHAGGQRLEVHVLDVLQRAGAQLAVLGPGRGDREAAVPGDHGGDAVEARRRQAGIPEHLGVVVGVDVDEAGRHHAPGGVEDGGAVAAPAA